MCTWWNSTSVAYSPIFWKWPDALVDLGFLYSTSVHWPSGEPALLLFFSTAHTESRWLRASSSLSVSFRDSVRFKRLSLTGAVVDVGLFLLPDGLPLVFGTVVEGGWGRFFGLFLLPGGLPLGLGTIGAGGGKYCCSSSCWFTMLFSNSRICWKYSCRIGFRAAMSG